MGSTPQEDFDWVPRRLEKFLSGPETYTRDFWYWHTLASFLRSKVAVANSNTDEDPKTNSTASKKSKEGKKGASSASSWIFDDDWKVHRVLGAGSFGTVALWVKRDAEHHIMDEMAIKHTISENINSWSGRSARLAKEAVLHHHMNKSEVENIVQLRGHKESDIAAMKKWWRFYLEFSPYGELTRLIDRYRAWQQYLPEAFLWHVFDSLALAILAKVELETHPKKLPRPNNCTAKDRIIHFDIKPDNIFLGYQEPFDATTGGKYGGMTQFEGKKRTLYPIIKLGDFGIAELVGGEDDADNPSTLWGMGTPFYKAPEMAHYGVTWRVPPNGTKRYRRFQNHDGTMRDIPSIIENDPNPGLYFGQELDIWNVGKVMYELVTLGRRWSHAKLSTRRFKKYRKWDYNAIPDFQTQPFSQVNSSRPREGEFHPYSAELMDLVKQCMKPRKGERISPEELRRQTQTQLQRYVNESEARLRERKGFHNQSAQDVEDQLLNEWKVYFAANGINDLNVGSENFQDCDGNVTLDGRKLSEAKDDVANLLGANTDPDWENLRLPQRFDRRTKAWRRKQGGKAANRYWNDICRTADDQIRFENLPPDARQHYRPLFRPSPEAKLSHEHLRGSLTEDGTPKDGAPGYDSTTTEESEGARKRKREQEDGPTQTVQDDSEPRAVGIAAEAGLQGSMHPGAAANTTGSRDTIAAAAQSNIAGNAQDSIVQSAPTVASRKTKKAKVAGEPRPTRDQPPRRAKNRRQTMNDFAVTVSRYEVTW